MIKIRYLVIIVFLIGIFIGSFSIEPVQAFIFGSLPEIPQWIKNNNIIRLRTETNNVRIGSNGTLYVDTNSNTVGINTTTPQAKLTTIGDFYVSATSTLMGKTFFGGGGYYIDSLGNGNLSSLILSTPLGVSSGGIGTSTVATGSLLYGSGGNSLNTLNIGTAGQILASNGTNPYWSSLNALSIVTGTGTINYIPKWISTNTLGTSTITDNGGNVGIGTTTPQYTLDVAGSIRAATSLTAGINVATITTSTITLTPGIDKMYQWLDPGTNNRTIILATTTAKAGDKFIIRNNSSISTSSYLVIKQNTNIDVIYPWSIREYIFDGTNWVAGDSATRINTDFSISFGHNAYAVPLGTAIGYNVNASNFGVAIGAASIGFNYGVAIGSNAGASLLADTSSKENVLIGSYSGEKLGSGSGNIMIGYKSGSYPTNPSLPTTGSYNILIGYNAWLPSTTTSNFLNIGGLIFGTNVSTSSGVISSGNIGIGTTTPQYKLTTIGDFYVSATSTLMGNVGIGTINPSQKLTVVGNIGIQAGINAFVGTLDNFALSLRTNNTDRIFITNTGNVGIGTSTPQGTLHIANALSSAALVVAPSGNVGIGTTTPQYTLDVAGSIRAATSVTAGINVATITTSTITLTPGVDKMYQWLTIGILNHPTITLATTTAKAGDKFIIKNNFSVVAGYFKIQQGTTTLDIISPYSIREYIFNGTDWVAGNVGTGIFTDQTVTIGYNANAGYSGGTAIGYNANAGSNDGTAIGYNANAGSSGGTAIGYQARSLNYGVAVGYQAGSNLTNGSKNIMIGHKAGYHSIYSPTIGSDNILIGNEAWTPSTTTSNFLNIGGLIFGTNLSTSAGIVSSGNIGIGTTTPQYKLTTIGDFYVSATSTLMGNVGIGTTTPSQKLTVVGNIGIQAGINAFVGTLDNFALSLRTNNTDRIFITNTGNIGIGTTTPQGRLHISGGNVFAEGGSLIVGRSSIPITSQFRALFCYTATCTVPNQTSTIIVGSINDSTSSVSIIARGTIMGSVPDYGEYVKIKGNSQDYEDGDLLEVASDTPETFQKSSQPYSEKLAGVKTKASSFIAGAGIYSQENSVVMALTGRVPVKVTTKNGKIKIGDLLTSSDIPGVAMKATEPGKVIGSALENYEGEGIGKILVFINPHWSIGSPENEPSIFDKFTLAIKKALEKLGLIIENSLAIIQKIFVKEIVIDNAKIKEAEIEKARINKIEMVDQMTGEIYCTWIENGIWQKVKGECNNIMPGYNNSFLSTQSSGQSSSNSTNQNSNTPTNSSNTTTNSSNENSNTTTNSSNINSNSSTSQNSSENNNQNNQQSSNQSTSGPNNQESQSNNQQNNNESSNGQ